MNHWTKISIEYANQLSYLDDLFTIYPTIPEGIREMDESLQEKISYAFNNKDNLLLVKSLIDNPIFPIKDSYIAYLRKDKTAIERNPATINRIAGRLYDLGLGEIFKRCTEPKETNRQIGPMFRRWINSKALGLLPISVDEFESTNDNAILDLNDAKMQAYAKDKFNYNRDKGLDFVARFNNLYVIGEAKFITDDGGHQHTQFDDAMEMIKDNRIQAKRIAILDGVLYIKSRRKMHKAITSAYNSHLDIMSALVLREYLYSLR